MKKRIYRIPEYKIVLSKIPFITESAIRLFVDRRFPKGAKFLRQDNQTGDFIFIYK